MDLTILNFFTDFNFVIKIFFLLFIIGFVKRKVTQNNIAVILISLAAVYLIFFYWPVFGTAYMFYILLTVGVSGIIVDVFFVTMGDSSPKDIMKAKADTPGSPGGAGGPSGAKQAMQNMRKMARFGRR